MKIFLLYIHTLRYLKPIQIYYRIYYFIHNKLNKPKLVFPSGKENYHYSFLASIPGIDPAESYQNGSFTFLNQTSKMTSLGYGKLWIYNLNYFDYLLQPTMTRDKGLELILDFIHKSEFHSIGLDPYPTSLRIVNWINFISRHSIDDPVIIRSLYDQSKRLLKNIEYHLLGNHILENGFALFTAGLFFNMLSLYKKGKQILISQLNEQILADGGHFELSPMYHAIMLNRLLNVVNILQQNPGTNQELLPFMKKKATGMIFWIREMTFFSGNIPLFNDAANKIAPETQQLLDYAARLDLSRQKLDSHTLSASGYKRYNSGRYEMIIDAGTVGPRYIPGHAHADMLNFELYVDGKPFIVDTGTSTYLPGSVRSHERSTSAHNTVTIGARDQSEMWGSHRVGRRAKCRISLDNPMEFCAEITGFPPLKATHQRIFRFQEDRIEILDIISNNRDLKGIAYFHFFPGVMVEIIDDQVHTSYGMLDFESHESVEVGEFNFAPEFNKTIPSPLLKIRFSKSLKTTILLNN